MKTFLGVKLLHGYYDNLGSIFAYLSSTIELCSFFCLCDSRPAVSSIWTQHHITHYMSFIEGTNFEVVSLCSFPTLVIKGYQRWANPQKALIMCPTKASHGQFRTFLYMFMRWYILILMYLIWLIWCDSCRSQCSLYGGSHILINLLIIFFFTFIFFFFWRGTLFINFFLKKKHSDFFAIKANKSCWTMSN